MEFNGVRFDPRTPRDHVESYFLKANEPEGGRALWLKATIFARAADPGSAVAEGWAVAFDRRAGVRRHTAYKTVIPIARATFDREALGVAWSAPDRGTMLLFRSGVVKGHIEPSAGASGSAAARVAWDLRYDAFGPPLELLPYAWMYTAKFPKSKLVSPVPDTLISGEAEVCGEKWVLDGWRGMQGHNWGRGHADLYAWCHVNGWDGAGEPLVLEAVSARVRTGPVLLPLLTVATVRWRGVDYRFQRPTEMVRADAHIEGLGYRVLMVNDLGRLEAEIFAAPEDTVGLYYANPVGPMTHCYNSKLATVRLTLETAGGAKVVRTSTLAALEIGTHKADPTVRMLV
jgi:hypothetical protein